MARSAGRHTAVDPGAAIARLPCRRLLEHEVTRMRVQRQESQSICMALTAETEQLYPLASLW